MIKLVLASYTYNFNELAKPEDMGAMKWLKELEAERNKADTLGFVEAFKGFSLEISATIAGKYGLSSRIATPEERAELTYSITRTRHKFSAEKEILSKFYGVGDVEKLPFSHQGHLAAILAIDTMAAEAMGNAEFLDQWSEIKPAQPANSQFVASVKKSVTTWGHESLLKILEPTLSEFLQSTTNIILAYEVFEKIQIQTTPFTIDDAKKHCLTALNKRFGAIKDFVVLNEMTCYKSFSLSVWCQVRDGEGQLFGINGSKGKINQIKLLQPEGPDIFFTECRPYDKFIQLKSKNPQKIGTFTLWEFDHTDWRSISEDDWIYSREERMRQLQTLYPGCTWRMESDAKGKLLAFMIDPSDVAIEKAIIFRHLGATDCEQTELFKAKADSIVLPSRESVNYYGPDGCCYAKKINFENMTLENALPVHPSISSWQNLVRVLWKKHQKWSF